MYGVQFIILVHLFISADIFYHETITAAISVELFEASALIIVTFLYYQVLVTEWAECLFESTELSLTLSLKPALEGTIYQYIMTHQGFDER